MQVTENQAKEFYRDLCGTVYGDSRKSCEGTMSVEQIADVMGIEKERAEEFCQAMICHGITERQGGNYVV